MDTAHIKNTIEELLRNIPIDFDSVDIEEDSDGSKKIFVIKTKDSGLLIGENGETFQALNHIIRRVADKNFEHAEEISIDVNDYRKSMIEGLKTKAIMLANRARDMKSSVEMSPMSSYERLIIHGALHDVPNIKTGSIGEGKERRVVIQYVD